MLRLVDKIGFGSVGVFRDYHEEGRMDVTL